VISSRSPHWPQRKSWLAASLRWAQAMQRNWKFSGRTPGVEAGTD